MLSIANAGPGPNISYVKLDEEMNHWGSLPPEKTKDKELPVKYADLFHVGKLPGSHRYHPCLMSTALIKKREQDKQTRKKRTAATTATVKEDTTAKIKTLHQPTLQITAQRTAKDMESESTKSSRQFDRAMKRFRSGKSKRELQNGSTETMFAAGAPATMDVNEDSDDELPHVKLPSREGTHGGARTLFLVARNVPKHIESQVIKLLSNLD